MKSFQQIIRPSLRPAVLKMYRITKWVAIIIIAASMAEFLAADIAMSVAGDILLYIEIIVAGWLFWLTARLWPGAAVAFGNVLWSHDRSSQALAHEQDRASSSSGSRDKLENSAHSD